MLCNKIHSKLPKQFRKKTEVNNLDVFYTGLFVNSEVSPIGLLVKNGSLPVTCCEGGEIYPTSHAARHNCTLSSHPLMWTHSAVRTVIASRNKYATSCFR
ncbi:hypothetical protein CEXT_362061 [Caerostris extrusa]|uniref:Uncharacterized protein n=1 Tax=Caerostris extrusa TaxID=172846 RepID=A0AAV4QCD9_CAEEX|nr:hypothetical protein CEXT_362061 [Caerostris extrusa]